MVCQKHESTREGSIGSPCLYFDIKQWLQSRKSTVTWNQGVAFRLELLDQKNVCALNIHSRARNRGSKPSLTRPATNLQKNVGPDGLWGVCQIRSPIPLRRTAPNSRTPCLLSVAMLGEKLLPSETCSLPL